MTRTDLHQTLDLEARNNTYIEIAFGYRLKYHQYFAEFLESADFAALIDETAELTAPYVEKTPAETKWPEIGASEPKCRGWTE